MRAVLYRLGAADLETYDPRTARHSWLAALRILEELESPHAQLVRSHLTGGSGVRMGAEDEA